MSDAIKDSITKVRKVKELALLTIKIDNLAENLIFGDKAELFNDENGHFSAIALVEYCLEIIKRESQ